MRFSTVSKKYGKICRLRTAKNSLLAVGLFLSPVAHANSEDFVNSMHVNIVIPQPLRMEERDLNLCDTLGQTLKPGQGIFGSGLFLTYECHTQQKNLPEGWVLMVERQNNRMTFLLRPQKDTFDKAHTARTSFGLNAQNLHALEDTIFVSHLAAALMDQLPVAYFIKDQKLEHPKALRTEVTPPESLTLFHLRRERTRIQSEKIADTKRKSSEDVLFDIPELQKNPPYWAHNSAGPGKKSREFIQGAAKRLGELRKGAPIIPVKNEPESSEEGATLAQTFPVRGAVWLTGGMRVPTLDIHTHFGMQVRVKESLLPGVQVEAWQRKDENKPNIKGVESAFFLTFDTGWSVGSSLELLTGIQARYSLFFSEQNEVINGVEVAVQDAKIDVLSAGVHLDLRSTGRLLHWKTSLGFEPGIGYFHGNGKVLSAWLDGSVGYMIPGLHSSQHSGLMLLLNLRGKTSTLRTEVLNQDLITQPAIMKDFETHLFYVGGGLQWSW